MQEKGIEIMKSDFLYTLQKFGSIVQDVGIFVDSGNPGKHFGNFDRLSKSLISCTFCRNCRQFTGIAENSQILDIYEIWMAQQGCSDQKLGMIIKRCCTAGTV